MSQIFERQSETVEGTTLGARCPRSDSAVVIIEAAAPILMLRWFLQLIDDISMFKRAKPLSFECTFSSAKSYSISPL